MATNPIEIMQDLSAQVKELQNVPKGPESALYSPLAAAYFCGDKNTYLDLRKNSPIQKTQRRIGIANYTAGGLLGAGGIAASIVTQTWPIVIPAVLFGGAMSAGGRLTSRRIRAEIKMAERIEPTKEALHKMLEQLEITTKSHQTHRTPETKKELLGVKKIFDDLFSDPKYFPIGVFDKDSGFREPVQNVESSNNIRMQTSALRTAIDHEYDKTLKTINDNKPMTAKTEQGLGIDMLSRSKKLPELDF